MTDAITKNLHFGVDGDGAFLCVTDMDGNFRRYRLSQSQVILLADQASAQAFKFASRAVRYDSTKDIEGSFADAYAAVRERVAAGGPGWQPR